jgi:energy-coupling factor transporter transmembrane protein EcfT
MIFGGWTSASARLIAGLFLSVSCLAVSTQGRAGMVCLAAVLTVSLFLFPVRPGILVRALVPAALFALPLAVLGPLHVPLRGMSGALTAVAAAAGLSPADLQRGLADLPLPRMVRMALIQTVHHTGVLRRETRGMMHAIKFRRRRGGLHVTWRLAVALPEVWLGRMFSKADRVAAGMTVRGFTAEHIQVSRSRWSTSDRLRVILSIGMFVLAMTLRWFA